MEIIRGRQSRDMDTFELQEILAGCENVRLDLGTGDGRFVRTLAGVHKDQFFIGLDSCRENLRLASRKAPANALFAIASAQSLPVELNGTISLISINFPWGSLLEGILNEEVCLLDGLKSVTRSSAAMELILNADAFGAAGWDFASGAGRTEEVLNRTGWKTKWRSTLEARDLRSLPTTWAKRLAFGRDPRAIRLCLVK